MATPQNEGRDAVPIIVATPDEEGRMLGHLYDGTGNSIAPAEASAALSAAHADPEFRRRMANYRISVERGEPSIAIAEFALDPGVDVLVVRQSSPAMRLLVLRSEMADALSLASAFHLLRHSEVMELHIPARTIISIAGDGRYEIVRGGVMIAHGQSRARNARWPVTQLTSWFARHADAPRRELDGFGWIRIVEDNG